MTKMSLKPVILPLGSDLQHNNHSCSLSSEKPLAILWSVQAADFSDLIPILIQHVPISLESGDVTCFLGQWEKKKPKLFMRYVMAGFVKM